MRELPAQGFVRYEISNFARAGFESRHNLGYWRNVPYLGVGAGAHGYADGVRWANESDTHAYISGIRADMSVRTPRGCGAYARERDGGVCLPCAAHGGGN